MSPSDWHIWWSEQWFYVCLGSGGFLAVMFLLFLAGSGHDGPYQEPRRRTGYRHPYFRSGWEAELRDEIYNKGVDERNQARYEAWEAKHRKPKKEKTKTAARPISGKVIHGGKYQQR